MIAAAITPPAAEGARAAANATLAPASKVVTLDVSPKAAAVSPAPAAAPIEVAPSAETAPAADASDAADTSSSAATAAVKDSLKAEPGKTLSTKRSTPAKQVRDSLQGTVKNVTDGLKKAAEGLSGKNTKPGKDATTKSGGDSSSSGSGAHNAA